MFAEDFSRAIEDKEKKTVSSKFGRKTFPI